MIQSINVPTAIKRVLFTARVVSNNNIFFPFSGPPNVVCTWRHWSNFKGPYKDMPPSGELIELFGILVAKVSDKLKIEELQVFYDPNPFMAKLMGYKQGECPILH